jgi:hypothetical protein
MREEILSEFEPVPGFPEALPEDEKILWQGTPAWFQLALTAFRLKEISIYFGLLFSWRLISGVIDGVLVMPATISAAWAVAPLAAGAFAILALIAWANARSTLYSITNRRVVLRYGVALPTVINIPFKVIAAAAVNKRQDGVGDIPLQLTEGGGLGYIVLWPHARPGHFSRPQPMLRSLPDVEAASSVLAGALQAYAAGTQPTGALATAAPSTGRPMNTGREHATLLPSNSALAS